MELISCYYNNLLAGYFGIEKTCKLLARKYYWPIFCHNGKVYVKGCDVCLALKAVRHKLYGDCKLFSVSMHQWNDLLIDFETGLPISIVWKGANYNSILVIINWLTKMVYYKPVKITIDASRFAKVIIDVVVHHHGLPDSIVTD